MAFRRPLRTRQPRPRSRPPVPPIVRRALAQAQRLKATGDLRGAASIYDRLAQQAYQRGRIHPGARMDLEAARAYLEAGDFDALVQRATRAIRALLERGAQLETVLSPVQQIIRALEAQGHLEDAQRFRAEVNALLQESGVPEVNFDGPPQASQPRRGKLPTQCPACNAPLWPDELVWLEPDRVSCAYCGSVVLTE